MADGGDGGGGDAADGDVPAGMALDAVLSKAFKVEANNPSRRSYVMARANGERRARFVVGCSQRECTMHVLVAEQVVLEINNSKHTRKEAIRAKKDIIKTLLEQT